MVLVVGIVLCGLPEYAQAQQQEGAAPQQQQNGTTIDPSKGPLQPVPNAEPADDGKPCSAESGELHRTYAGDPSAAD